MRSDEERRAEAARVDALQRLEAMERRALERGPALWLAAVAAMLAGLAALAMAT